MGWDLYLKDEPPCPTCGRSDEDGHVGNYTHNTNTMIRSASMFPEPYHDPPGVADEVLLGAETKGKCWDDFDGKKAGEVADFTQAILAELEGRPAHYDAMNPSNGWGSRVSLIEFIREVDAACRKSPDAVFVANG